MTTEVENDQEKASAPEKSDEISEIATENNEKPVEGYSCN